MSAPNSARDINITNSGLNIDRTEGLVPFVSIVPGAEIDEITREFFRTPQVIRLDEGEGRVSLEMARIVEDGSILECTPWREQPLTSGW